MNDAKISYFLPPIKIRRTISIINQWIIKHKKTGAARLASDAHAAALAAHLIRRKSYERLNWRHPLEGPSQHVSAGKIPLFARLDRHRQQETALDKVEITGDLTGVDAAADARARPAVWSDF
jgi:hypothetical protein